MPNTWSVTYWYLQLPSVILLAMIVLLLVRLALSPIITTGSMATRLVMVITQPVVTTVTTVTPRIVPAAGVIVCAIIWLTVARTVLFIVALAVGIRL